MSRFELRVNGPLASWVVELIDTRFEGVVASEGAGADTTVIVTGIDPAAQRALLNLLWDAGHDVVSMKATG